MSARGSPAQGVTALRDSLGLDTGPGRVVLYPLPSIHAEGILAAWVTRYSGGHGVTIDWSAVEAAARP